ncbi:Hypothetical predicted protein, partial [Olea europaea subsp. europaea]
MRPHGLNCHAAATMVAGKNQPAADSSMRPQPTIPCSCKSLIRAEFPVLPGVFVS